MSNVGSDPPTLAAILTGGALGKKLPAGLIGGTISDTYLPMLTDATNPWVTLFKSIEATYAPSLPWDGNVEYGMSEAYTFVQALKAAGQNPTRASIVAAVQNSHWTDGPGLTPYAYSSTDHNGFTGVQMVAIGADRLAHHARTDRDHRRHRDRCHHHVLRGRVDAAVERHTERLTCSRGPRGATRGPWPRRPGSPRRM